MKKGSTEEMEKSSEKNAETHRHRYQGGRGLEI